MVLGVSTSHYREVPPSISFSGSGFMATYQLGVAQGFLIYAPWILHTAPSVLGASAGSLVAAAVVCEMSLVTIRDEMLNFAKQMKSFTFGPLNPSINVFHWLECTLRKHLPDNAHQLANGRLAVAVTRLTDGKQIVLSKYQSREDVIQALLCSCFVPGYCGMFPPSFKGVQYLDGGFSSMQPVLPLAICHTLTVSPFSGEVDICPTDSPCMWDMVVSGSTLKGNMANSFRIMNALYPMALETLEQAYQRGYKDAIHFLLNNELVSNLMINGSPINYSQSNAPLCLVNAEEEEMMAEKETTTSTSFKDDKWTQMNSSTELQSNGELMNKEPPLPFDIANSVLLGNLVMSVGTSGLLARITSYLLLPFLVSLLTILQTKCRLELLLKQARLLYWAWQCLKHFFYFFFNIVVCTMKKNIKDRAMHIILLFRWLKFQAQSEAPQGQRSPMPSHKLSCSSHSEGVRHGGLQ